MIGLPAEEIIKACNKPKADLLVMGSNGRGAAASALLVFSTLTRRPRAALAALLGLLVLHRELYALLARRGGAPLLLGGFGLHIAHQLVALAAVPAGIAAHLREGRR